MIRCICAFIACIFCISCTDKEKNELILSAERMVNQYPDSVYHILKDRTVSDFHSDKEKADFALVYTEALYKSMREVESDSIIRIAWEYYGKGDDLLKAAKTNYYMGKVYSYMDSISRATEYVVYAEHHALNIQNNNLLGLIYNELGELYLNQTIVDKALEYYKKSQYHFHAAVDDINEAYVIGYIGKCFLYANQLDSAMHYYLVAKKKAEEKNDSAYIYHLNSELIPLYVRVGKIKNAKHLTFELYARNHDRIQYYYNLSDCYYFNNQIDSAKYAIKQLLSKDYNSLSLTQKISAYIRLRTFEEELGNYQNAYQYSLKYEDVVDSLDTEQENNYVLKVEEKYRNKMLKDQNYILEIKNYTKSISLIVLVLIVIILIFSVLSIVNYYRRFVARKNDMINQYLALIEELKEGKQTSGNDLLNNLNANTEKEQHLKSALEKRLGIIKQLTALSYKYGDNEKFSKKIKELMSVNVLTQDTLADLLEVVNINYFGIIDFLRLNYNLTKDELVLCSFISSGFSPQEMSVLYNISVENVYVRCNRLGKKMDTKFPLVAFIHETLIQLQEAKI